MNKTRSSSPVADYTLNHTPSPIESISGIWKFIRSTGHRSRTISLPGHLLQLVLKGSYAIRTNNREYTVKQDDLIYFYASEDVEWLRNDQEVSFYSVGFHSSSFTPLPLYRRVFPSNTRIRTAFETLYESKTLGRESGFEEFMMFGALNRILTEVVKLDVYRGPKAAIADIWWDVERSIRKHHLFRPTLNQIAELCGYSRASTVRLCRKATGQSPARRIQTIRMEEAKALLAFSSLNITEISGYLSYPRVHEFSREFSGYFKVSPRTFREMNRRL